LHGNASTSKSSTWTIPALTNLPFPWYHRDSSKA